MVLVENVWQKIVVEIGGIFGGKLWWTFFVEMPYLISLNPLLQIFSIHWVLEALCICLCLCMCVFVFVCVCVSLSFFKYPSRSLSSPDDRLSENIWFVWFRTSYSGDKWLKVGGGMRCYHGDRQTTGK